MKGRCLCGAGQYELSSPPQQAYYCHCRDCQYLSGSTFHLLAIIERGGINRISGELGKFKHPTEDGSEMSREFCIKCGTPLFVTSTRFEDIEMFTLNSLDDPEVIDPSFEIWTRSKRSSAHIAPDIASYATGALDH